MEQLPQIYRLSEPEKDALIQELWAETQALKARIVDLEANSKSPKRTPTTPAFLLQKPIRLTRPPHLLGESGVRRV